MNSMVYKVCSTHACAGLLSSVGLSWSRKADFVEARISFSACKKLGIRREQNLNYSYLNNGPWGADWKYLWNRLCAWRSIFLVNSIIFVEVYRCMLVFKVCANRARRNCMHWTDHRYLVLFLKFWGDKLLWKENEGTCNNINIANQIRESDCIYVTFVSKLSNDKICRFSALIVHVKIYKNWLLTNCLLILKTFTCLIGYWCMQS